MNSWTVGVLSNSEHAQKTERELGGQCERQFWVRGTYQGKNDSDWVWWTLQSETQNDWLSKSGVMRRDPESIKASSVGLRVVLAITEFLSACFVLLLLQERPCEKSWGPESLRWWDKWAAVSLVLVEFAGPFWGSTVKVCVCQFPCGFVLECVRWDVAAALEQRSLI